MIAFYRCKRGHYKEFSNDVEVSGDNGNELDVQQDDFLPPTIIAFCEECNNVRPWEMDPEKSKSEGLWDY